MKAITLWQPWASLIAVGAKTIETRSWSTKYRGPLAIHAAKRPARFENMKSLVGDLAWDQWFSAGLVSEDGSTDEIPYGAIVATCDLVDMLPMVGWYDDVECIVVGDDSIDHCIPGPDEGRYLISAIDDQRPYGEFAPGRFAWMLKNIQLIEPVPAKGKQGLWEWAP